MPVTPETRAMVLLAAEICEEKKATDTRILELDPVDAGFTDFFLVTSCTNTRQTGAVADEIELRMKRQFGVYAKSVEGRRTGEWILLDYIDFVVHIFTEETREFYDIERLRKSARTLGAAQMQAQVEAELQAALKQKTQAVRKKAPKTIGDTALAKTGAADLVPVKGAAKKALKKAAKKAPKKAAGKPHELLKAEQPGPPAKKAAKKALAKVAKKAPAKAAAKKAPGKHAEHAGGPAKKAVVKAAKKSVAKKAPGKKSTELMAAKNAAADADAGVKKSKEPKVQDTSRKALPAGRVGQGMKQLPAPKK